MIHPDFAWPDPSEDGGVRGWVRVDDELQEVFGNDLESMTMEGNVYPDGTGYPRTLKHLNRAGWAVVQTDEQAKAGGWGRASALSTNLWGRGVVCLLQG